MKHILILLALIGVSFITKAQTAEDTVKVTVTRLFEAMKNGDAAELKNCFADSAILQTINKNKEGKIIIQNETVDEFSISISKLPKGDADERIQFDIVKIDGPLAIVWAPYKFFYKGKFSHCGVDSFQLVKINGEWKIQYLIDTRRKNKCD